MFLPRSFQSCLLQICYMWRSVNDNSDLTFVDSFHHHHQSMYHPFVFVFSHDVRVTSSPGRRRVCPNYEPPRLRSEECRSQHRSPVNCKKVVLLEWMVFYKTNIIINYVNEFSKISFRILDYYTRNWNADINDSPKALHYTGKYFK